MKRDSKVLNKVIELTEKGKINWITIIDGNDFKYTTTYKITNSKYIDIIFYHNQNKSTDDYIVFNYYNSEKNKKVELKEIYPYAKWSPFSYWKLRRALKKLQSKITLKPPVIRRTNHPMAL